MNWVRGDKYYLKAEGWTICRVNIEDTRIYELHNTKTGECVASAKAKDDEEGRKAVKHLKDVAHGL